MVVCSHPQPAASKELQDFLLARLGLMVEDPPDRFMAAIRIRQVV